MRAAFCLLAFAACTPEIDAYKPLDLQPARELDVLFVIDDSADRGNFDPIASQLDVLTARLADIDGQLPSLHVGVVTTDLGVSGVDDVLPRASIGTCIGFGKAGQLQGFVEDLRGPNNTRIRNYASGDLPAELASLTSPAALPPGCDYEQPLEAMRRALDPETNPGFIRKDAMLAVVFITNEDDCSLATGAMLDPADTSLGPPTKFRCTQHGVICDPDDPSREGAHLNCRPRDGSPYMVDVSEYEAFLAGFKADRRDVLVSAVVGPRTSFVVRNLGSPVLRPSCEGAGGTVAYPAVRIGSLVDRFGGVMVDACTQEAAYQQITKPILDRQRSCLPTLARAERDGCTVMEVAGDTATELAACTDGMAGPCFYTYADAAACPDGDNLGIAVRRPGAAPEGARLQARCFVP